MPNPATERCVVELGIEWLGEDRPTVTVLDLLGRRHTVPATVEGMSEPGLRVDLDVRGLPVGYYVIEATGKGGRSIGGMMVVRGRMKDEG